MKKLVSILGCGVLALGCHSEPPRELLDARVAYQRAQQNPGARLATADMYDARTDLNAAERSFRDDGDSQETRDAAYVAQRRAVAANAKANALQSLEQKRLADVDLAKFRANMAAANAAQLDATKNALAGAQSEIESQRQARAAADKRAHEAFDKIAGLKAEQSDRGLVLTLSGSVLFATGKSTLLPAAQGRLKEVANALKEDKRSITIVGHTDSTGGDELNQKLSQARADAVRGYLVSQAVPADRIRTEGLGEKQPIADNGTPEGRANNRRVEIILENEPGSTRK